MLIALLLVGPPGGMSEPAWRTTAVAVTGILLGMVGKYGLVVSGFGSFEDV